MISVTKNTSHIEVIEINHGSHFSGLKKFPDFSSLAKIPWLFPDWKISSHFSRFSSPSGNPVNAKKFGYNEHLVCDLFFTDFLLNYIVRLGF